MRIFTPEFSRDEGGAATVWSIFWAIVFLTLGGLVIDTSNAFRHKAALQATADASSLAAIISFIEQDTFNTAFGPQNPAPATPSERGILAGHLLANTNMDPAKNNGSVTPEKEVTMGFWDTTKSPPEFIPEADFTSGMTVNAAKVRSLRTAANNNPLNLLLVDLFGAADFWDVGATSIAMTYTPPNCPTKEGIMAGGTLFFSGVNTFIGDVCLHGEEQVNLTSGNEFISATIDGTQVSPSISYGVEGALCIGNGNCSDEYPWEQQVDLQSDAYPLDPNTVDPEATHMPNVPAMYAAIVNIVDNPLNGLYLADNSFENRYYPRAIVANPKRDPVKDDVDLVNVTLTQEQIDKLPTGSKVSHHTGYNVHTGAPVSIPRITITAQDYVAAMVGANGTKNSPFPPNVIIDIDHTKGSCGYNNNVLSLTGDAPITSAVVITPCRFEVNGSNFVDGSMIVSTFSGSGQGNGAGGGSNAAIYASSNAVMGNGSCTDGTHGAVFATAGEVYLASGATMRGSRIIALDDVHLAAQGDGFEGAQIISAQDIHIASGSIWQGCPNGFELGIGDIDHYYQLVY